MNINLKEILSKSSFSSPNILKYPTIFDFVYRNNKRIHYVHNQNDVISTLIRVSSSSDMEAISADFINQNVILISKYEGQVKKNPTQYDIEKSFAPYKHIPNVKENQFFISAQFSKNVYTPKHFLRKKIDDFELVDIPNFSPKELISYEDFEYSFVVKDAGCIFIYSKNNQLIKKIELFETLKNEYDLLSRLENFGDRYDRKIGLDDFSHRNYKIVQLTSFKFSIEMHVIEFGLRHRRNEIAIYGTFDIYSNKWIDFEGSCIHIDS